MQHQRYALYYTPRGPLARLRWWLRRHRPAPVDPKADGRDYVGWTARIRAGAREGFPPAGSVGPVIRSVVHCGETTHEIAFEQFVMVSSLPAEGIELIPPPVGGPA